MSIRIRVVDGVTIAICAARSVEKPGDIYLDDAAHHALSGKFSEDFASEGYNVTVHYPDEAALRAREESNNPNRAWWDLVYGEWPVRIQSVGLIEDPHALAPVSQRFFKAGEPQFVSRHFFEARFPLWDPNDTDPHYVPRENPASDTVIDAIKSNPRAFAPRNPYYQKNHVNAPGTVRQWFRKMRAADFDRDLLPAVSYHGVENIDVLRGSDKHPGWTVFDTQQVVDRETAAHYLKPPRDEPFYEGIDYGFTEPWIADSLSSLGTPAIMCGLAETTGMWLGLDRSTVPEFAPAHKRRHDRSITPEDLQRFAREDDARRFERRSLAWRCVTCGHEAHYKPNTPNEWEALEGVTLCQHQVLAIVSKIAATGFRATPAEYQRATQQAIQESLKREDDARRGERRRQDGPADEFIAWLVRETAADTWDPSVVAEVRDHLAEIIRRSERR